MEPTRRVTGRQLTTMVVAICAAVVLAPVGVYAAAHSRVSIVDAKHPTRGAAVTTAGAQVITGSVTSRAGLPTGTPYVQTVTNPSHLTIPAGKHLVVTSITAATNAAAGEHVSADLDYKVGSKNTLIWLNLPDAGAISSTEFFYGTLPMNLTLSGGGTLTPSAVAASGEKSLTVTVFGYLV